MWAASLFRQLSFGASFLLVAVCVGSLLSCGDATSHHAAEAGAIEGTVRIDGSSTVFPITQLAKAAFEKDFPGVRVELAGTEPGTTPAGSGGGFRAFVRGHLDISAASRAMRAEERETADLNGIDFLELPLGYDGISVVVHPENDLIESITTDELRLLWKPDSPVHLWSDLRPEFPDRPIRLVAPGTDSGTYDYFTEEIVGTARRSRPDFLASEDDERLVQAVLAHPDSLGFFGYGYVAAHPELKVLAVDSGGGPVAPSPETIASGEYKPLARPLYLYVSLDAARRDEVNAFLEFLLQNIAQFVEEAGYAPMPAADYEQVRSTYRHAAGREGQLAALPAGSPAVGR